MNGDLAAEISELLDHLNRITVPAPANVDWLKIRDLQRRLDGKSSTLYGARRRSAELGEELRWVESDIHGFERALVLVGSDESDETAGAAKLERRLATQLARVDELGEEITAVDERISQIESNILSTQQVLAVVLRGSINGAERKIQAAKAARQQRQAQCHTATAEIDESPLWSPHAVMGYRVWAIKETGMYGAWERWATPAMAATCETGSGGPHTDGRCAEIAFGCGIYASKSPLELIEITAGGATKGFAAGLVGMEGKVIEHQRGYRAASATVLALAVAENGMVRLIDDTDELNTMFAQGANAPGLGDVRFPMIQDAEPMREIMAEYLESQAQRRATWTSASPSE